MKKQYISVVLCTILAAALGTQAQAAPTTNTWLGTSDANWSQPTNWSLSHVPTSTEAARFPQEATARTITMPANAEACRIDIPATTGYAFLSGGKLTLTKHPDDDWILFNTAVGVYFNSDITYSSTGNQGIYKVGAGNLVLRQSATNSASKWVVGAALLGFESGTFPNVTSIDNWSATGFQLSDARLPNSSLSLHYASSLPLVAGNNSLGMLSTASGVSGAYFQFSSNSIVMHITGLAGQSIIGPGTFHILGGAASTGGAVYYDEPCTNLFQLNDSMLRVWTYAKLIVNGTFNANSTNNEVRMEGNTVLAGVGKIAPFVNLYTTATLAPGSNLTATAGALTVSNVTMTAGSIFKADLLGATAGTQYDQLVVRPNAKLTLAGATLQLNLGFAPLAGEKYKLIDAGSGATVVGQFACGTSISATYNSRTYKFTVNYAGGDGNDVVLYVPAGTVVSVK